LKKEKEKESYPPMVAAANNEEKVKEK